MKYLKKFGKVLLAIPLLLIGTMLVHADTNDSNLIKNKYDGYMAAYDAPDRIHMFWAERYTQNGTTAYCIEPLISITTEIYSSTTDWGITGLSADVRNYIRLVAYYGYDYSGHNTMKYYFAAQELIWEKIKGREVYWVEGTSKDGPRVNVDAEKNEINRLVSIHATRPSFDDNTIEVNLGESKTITDNNGVLSTYQIYHSDIDASISGNNLTVKSNSVRGNSEVQLIKKNYTSKVNFLYYNGESQKMISSGVLDPVISSLTIKTNSGNVSPKKLDRETGEKAQGDGTLKGAKYNVINSNGDVVDTLITGSENERSKELPYGNYKLKEVTPSVGYELDENEYVFTLDNNNIDIKVDVFENVIKRKVNLFKVYASEKTGILLGEPNIKFDIYLKSNNSLYKSITTDKNGLATATLPYGTYTVKQITTTKDYEKLEDFEIAIDHSEKDPMNKILSNAEIKARLKVIKIDEDTGKVIKRSNISFKVFDVNKNDYVCQTITYPKGETICEYKTDENGILITPYPLNSGKYKLEEVEQAIDGYVWNKESVEFEIGEETELITDNEFGILFETKFSNKEVKGTIEINKIGEDLVIEDGTYEYIENKLEGVVLGVYASSDIYNGVGDKIYKKDELVSKVTTDENGYAKLEKLHLGKYYIKELKTLDGYVLDETKHEFELKYKDHLTEIVTYSIDIHNYLRKGKLEFTKVDVSTSDPLPNTKIEIYTENDELIFSGITNEEGKIIIEDLPVGKFYILEKEAPEGYTLNDEKMWFEIKEDGEIVKATMTDDKLIIEVPNTLKNDNNVIELSLIVVLASGLCITGLEIFKYAKKKKEKKNKDK